MYWFKSNKEYEKSLIGGIGRHDRFRIYYNLFVLVQIQCKAYLLFIITCIFLTNFFYWVDEYSLLLTYLIVILLFVSFLWFLVVNLSYSQTLFEKTSQYECGFEPFGHTSIFDLQYFLIGLLYLVFDVELVLIIPWLFSLSVISFAGNIVMLIFLILFVIGLIYEWKKNVLHWT